MGEKIDCASPSRPVRLGRAARSAERRECAFGLTLLKRGSGTSAGLGDAAPKTDGGRKGRLETLPQNYENVGFGNRYGKAGWRETDVCATEKPSAACPKNAAARLIT